MKHLIPIFLVVVCAGLIIFDSAFGLLHSPWWGIGLLILCVVAVTGFFYGIIAIIKDWLNK